MYAGKPIIGIVGGIGSGKSHVARLFGGLGCAVIDADQQVRDAYQQQSVKDRLRAWWGDEVFLTTGEIKRSAIAARVFSDPKEKQRLETLLHPLVQAAREERMRAMAGDVQVVAFVWDTPLLLEVGLADRCDAIVFVDAPFSIRLARVRATRGWDEHELVRREKLQMPLDKKKDLSDHVVTNAADADSGVTTGVTDGIREQIRQVLSLILAGSTLP